MIGDWHVTDPETGAGFYETDSGPMVMVTCDDCGQPAAAALDYTGVVRCSACWPRFHGLDQIKAAVSVHNVALGPGPRDLGSSRNQASQRM